jgi:Trypsin
MGQIRSDSVLEIRCRHANVVIEPQHENQFCSNENYILHSSVCQFHTSTMDAFLVIILMAVAVESRHHRPGERMYHGHNAEPHSAPYIVALKIVPINEFLQPVHICGGSILNEYWVLSAGHCVTSIDEIIFQLAAIYAGAHDFQESPTAALQIRQIVEKVVHPEMIAQPEKAPIEYADLSLLRVSDRFEFNEFVQKITMAPAGYKPSGEATVFGWGDVLDFRDFLGET